MNDFLEIKNLTLQVGDKNPTPILNGVSFTVGEGETVALVGESGSGKSMTIKSILRLFPEKSTVGGEILYRGRNVLDFPKEELGSYRKTQVAMIFQDPRSAINPVRSIGDFLVDGLRNSRNLSKRDALTEAEKLLEQVRLSHPRERLKQFPHELSGGMLQRVMIASAVGTGAKLLLADEPTTALDVSIQAEIMSLLSEMKKDLGLSVIFVTHDIDLALATSSRIDVMYAGQIVESRKSSELPGRPFHPYTAGLIASKPDIDRRVRELPVLQGQPVAAVESLTKCAFSSRCAYSKPGCEKSVPQLEKHGSGMVRCFRAPEIQKDLERLVGTETEELGLENLNEKIIEVRNLSKSFSIRKSRSAVKAVDDVSFFVRKGETLGVVGESGSGKSTVAKILLGIERLDSGDVLVCGESRNSKAKNWKQRKMWGGQLQVVFQDPFTSLDPRQTPHQAIDEVLQLHFPTRNRQKSIDELLKSVGIFENLQHSLPSELSGGQLQRVAIAKALAAQPEAIILDEAVSGLDVSIQAQILNLLSELQQKTGVTFLFISHDLAVVRQLCHRVIVMKKGKVVEEGLTVDVLSSPKDDYTRRLIDSAPRPNWILPGSLSA